MTSVPAMYGEVSAGARAAYALWIDALFAQTDHVTACSGACGQFSDCPTYAQLHEREQAAWRDWHAVRRQERT